MYDICNVLTHVHTNYTHTHTHHRFNVLCSHLSATCWLNSLIKIQLLEHQLLQAARVLWSHAHGHHQLSASPTLSFRSPLTAFISPEGRGCHQMRHTRRCLCTATHWLTRSIHPLVIAAITQLHICCSLAPAQEHSEIHTVFKICTRKAPTQDSSLTDVDKTTTPVTSGNNAFPLLCRKHHKTWHVYYIIAWEQIFCRSLFTCLQAGVPSFCLMASRRRLVQLQNVVGHIEKPKRAPRAENIQQVGPRSISSSDICRMSVQQRQCPQVSADLIFHAGDDQKTWQGCY